MKKFLFASTALVASTSFAAAADIQPIVEPIEVIEEASITLSGSAEMGIAGADSFDDDSDFDTGFHTDIDVDFSMAGTTDGGLTFGASVDLDSVDQEDEDGNIGAFDGSQSGSDTVIFISGAFGTLTMGDTDGALDFAMSEAIIGSSLTDNHEHAGYNGNSGLDGTYDGQVARYDYALGDFAVAVSAELEDEETALDFFDADPDNVIESDGDPVLGIGATYNGSFGGFDFGAGLGYQYVDRNQVTATGFDELTGESFNELNDDESSIIGASLSSSVFGFDVVLNYTDYDNVFSTSVGDAFNVDGDDTQNTNDIVALDREFDNHYGIAVGYEFDRFLVAANYGEFDLDGGELSGIGAVVNYDLGGGASLQFGYGYNKIEATDVISIATLEDGTVDIGDGDDIDEDFSTFSFGIAMSF